MTEIEFKAWSKIPRLNRDMVITEKIDGSNAAIGIVDIEANEQALYPFPANATAQHGTTAIYAQSRKRIITPEDDNFGFAKWVETNAELLISQLGVGLHFGEWWGSGIQRGYGLKNGEKRFSLFNTVRYSDDKFNLALLKDIGVDTVPVLYEGTFSQHYIMNELAKLANNGSQAAPGFKDPEGIVVFHTASNTPYKVTIENDEKPKGSAN